MRFHESPHSEADIGAVQDTIRRRVLRLFKRRGLLTPEQTTTMMGWSHGGGFSSRTSLCVSLRAACAVQIVYPDDLSVDAKVRIDAETDGAWSGCCAMRARPVFALERLAWVGEHQRRIVNLAATEWMDENGLTWLAAAPKIKLLPNLHKRQPHPLSWDEQDRLFQELPKHLAVMALFAVNTGCRDGEICRLRWDWEIHVPELRTNVFIIPGEHVKNSEE